MVVSIDPVRLSRRAFAVGCAALWSASRRATLVGDPVAQPHAASPDPQCPRCGGLGRVPLMDARPFVWLKGAAAPKGEAMVGEQFCPQCRPEGDERELAAEAKAQFEAALAKHEFWERETGWKLACVVTRHAAIHTQAPPAQARSMGAAIETALLHFKRLAGSLALATSRPGTLGLVVLWEKASWDKFRAVMERLFTPAQLGEEWGPARDYNAYDQYTVPHFYETPQTARARPPSCGATFLVARRQLHLATNRRTPFWLLEGFAAYGDNVVHKTNRWYSVYDVKQVPIGNWLADARKLAAEARLRPWADMIVRPLADWQWEDHVQTLAMAAYLLETDPRRFIDLLKRLQAGDDPVPALESAYRTALDDLDEACTRWLLDRR